MKVKHIIKFIKSIVIIPIYYIVLFPLTAIYFSICSARDGVDLFHGTDPKLTYQPKYFKAPFNSRKEILTLILSLLGLGILSSFYNLYSANRMVISLNKTNTVSEFKQYFLIVENQRMTNISLNRTNYLKITFSDTITNANSLTVNSSHSYKLEGTSLYIYDLKIRVLSNSSFLVGFRVDNILIKSIEFNNKSLVSYQLLSGYNRSIVLFVILWLVFIVLRIGIIIRIIKQQNNYNRWLQGNLFHIEEYLETIREKDFKKFQALIAFLSVADNKTIFIDYPEFYTKFKPPYVYNNLSNLKRLRLILIGSFIIDLLIIIFLS